MVHLIQVKMSRFMDKWIWLRNLFHEIPLVSIYLAFTMTTFNFSLQTQSIFLYVYDNAPKQEQYFVH